MLESLKIREKFRMFLFMRITETLAVGASGIQDIYDKIVIVDLLSFRDMLLVKLTSCRIGQHSHQYRISV